MTLRITPHRQLELSQIYSQSHVTKSNALQNQISSGERIHKPSDHPEGQRTILNQQAAIARLETQIGSITHARVHLNQGSADILEANRLLVQAKSLALEARQETEQSSLNVIADELDGYLHTLETIANSKLNGRYLFGGAAHDQPPFSGIMEGPVEYHGSRQTGDVIFAQGEEMPTFLTGQDVFEFVSDSSDGRLNVFDVVRSLRDELRNRSEFESSAWGNQIDQRIAELDESSTHLLNVVGEQSVSLQRLDQLETRAEDLKLAAETLLSDTQSPDFAEAILQLQEEQNLLQFSLATVTRIFDLSVLDFLR